MVHEVKYGFFSMVRCGLVDRVTHFGCVDETSALIETDVGATCEGALIQCGSECIDTAADLAHCGGCDQAGSLSEIALRLSEHRPLHGDQVSEVSLGRTHWWMDPHSCSRPRSPCRSRVLSLDCQGCSLAAS